MQCPFCKEEIIEGALKCKHCGSMLSRHDAGERDVQRGSTYPVRTKPMQEWHAFLLAIVFLVIIAFLPLEVVVVGIFISSVWAAYDASQVGTKKYKSTIVPTSPGWIFVGCLVLWIVVFPWYLYFRSHVKSGVAELSLSEVPVDPKSAGAGLVAQSPVTAERRYSKGAVVTVEPVGGISKYDHVDRVLELHGAVRVANGFKYNGQEYGAFPDLVEAINVDITRNSD
jgi:hypothetical protein